MSQRIRVLQFLLFLYRYANDHQVGAFVLLPLATKILPSVIVTTVITRFNSTGNNYLPNEQGKNENENDGGDGDKPRYRSKLQRLNQATRAGQARARSTKDSNINSVPLNSRKPEAEPDFRETKGRKKKEKQKNVNVDADFDDIISTFPPSNEEYSIDSFLRGEYDRSFSEDAAAPHPELAPSETIENALYALRELDIPEISHGAAVFARFLTPLSRSDRWGGSVSGALSSWKEIIRGSLTPTMLARRIRASEEFSVLLDWERIDVTDTEGLAVPGTNDILGGVAFVNAALFFRSGAEPSVVQFTLRKISGVWLIDSAVTNKMEWFVDSNDKDAN
jgi:hypothetical protein